MEKRNPQQIARKQGQSDEAERWREEQQAHAMRIAGAAASMVQLQMQHQAIAAERQVLLQTHANLCEFRLR